MKKLILCLIVICFILGCSNDSTKNPTISSISVNSVFSMIEEKNVYILDVREDYEYNSGHIQNAYNIPVSKINTTELNFISLDSTIIVYCQSGKRSRKAAQTLLSLGYQNVFDMGSIHEWSYDLVID